MNSSPFLGTNLANLALIQKSQSRSISPENPTGAKGAGALTEPEPMHPSRELGRGWKCCPAIKIESGATAELAVIDGPGVIQQIWLTPTGYWRHLVMRIYWDDQPHPSVECPVNDFFANGWGTRETFVPVNSLPVCVNPGSAFNCYWTMPFRSRCRVTLENVGYAQATVYYQINYALQEIPADAAYFHAQFRRMNPTNDKEEYVILDGIDGPGHYVGTYVAWGVNSNGWWGEGEVKFFIDDDGQDPTICYTGTEDYFGGSYNFENLKEKRYQEYSTPYAGLPQVVRPDGLYQAQTRFSMYRWHIPDPVRFEKNLRVNLQALGWRRGEKGVGRFRPLRDDIASVAYWYQALPTVPFRPFLTRDELEIT